MVRPQHSLAIEILAHVFVDRFASSVGEFIGRFDTERQGTITGLMEKLKERTDVIDCGEAAVDGNRRIWDMLVPFRSFVYAAFGAAA